LTGGKGSSVGGAGGTGEAAESGRASPARRDDAGKRVPKSNQSLQLSSAKPRFDAAAGPVSAEGLRRLGRTGLQFQAAAATYTPAEADRLAEPFTSELVTAAPADLTDQLRDCIDEVLAKDASLLPVYAAEGELDGRPVLITGFARSPDGSERLDHYEVWAWPQGSCAAPLSVGSGRIAP
jgi:hypothetical protein